jgi:hypothetical protein
MPPKDRAIRRWWPSTQSLDLVEAPVQQVAEALQPEITRFAAGEPIAGGWHQFENLDAAFGAASDFDSLPTFYLALPTRSKWTVLWNNSFLCDGYDSLCWCLTHHHGLTTIHWSAHDAWTTFQSGASFTYREHDGANVVERYIYCGQEDKRWLFRAIGQPLDEENTADYAARRKRDRLNEQSLLSLLGRLGARPWSEDFYALPEQRCFAISRTSPPPTAPKRTREQVLRPLPDE